jgi:hypothetical protein
MLVLGQLLVRFHYWKSVGILYKYTEEQDDRLCWTCVWNEVMNERFKQGL